MVVDKVKAEGEKREFRCFSFQFLHTHCCCCCRHTHTYSLSLLCPSLFLPTAKRPERGSGRERTEEAEEGIGTLRSSSRDPLVDIPSGWPSLLLIVGAHPALLSLCWEISDSWCRLLNFLFLSCFGFQWSKCASEDLVLQLFWFQFCFDFLLFSNRKWEWGDLEGFIECLFWIWIFVSRPLIDLLCKVESWSARIVLLVSSFLYCFDLVMEI